MSGIQPQRQACISESLPFPILDKYDHFRPRTSPTAGIPRATGA